LIYVCQKMEKPRRDDWPLNLIWAVAEMVADKDSITIKFPINENHEKGVRHALDGLPKTVAKLMLRYYSENMTLSGIGKLHKMRPKRAERIIKYGVHLLSTSTTREYVFYGYNYANRAENARRLEYELKVRERILANRQEKIAQKQKLHDQSIAALDRVSTCESVWTIEDLELTTYTYNCLRRSGCKSIEDLIDKVASGELTMIRGIGRSCTEDVLAKIYKFTGEDFSYLYGITFNPNVG